MTFLLEWFFKLWVYGFVIVLIIDWLEDFPRCLGDTPSVQKYLRKKKEAGDSNPRLSLVRLTASVLICMGPLGIRLPPIKYDIGD